jgi:hypothetical protein
VKEIDHVANMITVTQTNIAVIKNHTFSWSHAMALLGDMTEHFSMSFHILSLRQVPSLELFYDSPTCKELA